MNECVADTVMMPQLGYGITIVEATGTNDGCNELLGGGDQSAGGRALGNLQRWEVVREMEGRPMGSSITGGRQGRLAACASRPLTATHGQSPLWFDQRAILLEAPPIPSSRTDLRRRVQAVYFGSYPS